MQDFTSSTVFWAQGSLALGSGSKVFRKVGSMCGFGPLGFWYGCTSTDKPRESNTTNTLVLRNIPYNLYFRGLNIMS